MRGKRLAIGLLLVLLLGLCPPVRAEEETPAARIRGNGSPYCILVNRAANTVTVYGLGSGGTYSVPLRAMVCSTGREGHRTPLGTFAITGVKNAWCYMVDGSYGQYASQFKGNYLFHSVCYTRADPSTLMTEEYNALGEAASRGCVRLQTADAKWIFDNCPAGTRVTVYESDDPGPLGKPGTLVGTIGEEQPGTWDPSDGREDNPWRALLPERARLSETALSLAVGDSRALTVLAEGGEGVFAADSLVWVSTDPAVAAVDSAGTVTAAGEGSAEIRALSTSYSAACTVTVSDDALPFDDVAPGRWYYGDVRYVWERGLLTGTGERRFSPEETVTREMALQLLYNLAGESGEAAPDEAWYTPALAWAAEKGITDEKSPADFVPGQAVSRQDFLLLLYRYESACTGHDVNRTANLSAYADAASVDKSARTAVGWAVSRGLLRGDGQRLLPEESLNRAQLSALLRRYGELFS